MVPHRNATLTEASAAPSPATNTAASHSPSRESRACPTAYTPRYLRMQRPVGHPLRDAGAAQRELMALDDAVLDRHEEPGLAVHDDFDDPARRGGDDRGLAGHRLEVDDPERLVDRRAREHRRVAEDLDHLRLGQHLLDPEDAVARLAQLRDA